MFAPLTIASAILLACLSAAIFYTDIRYRRIPNNLVLVALIGGLAVNTFFGGTWGLILSLGGFALAFTLTLLFHILGTLGAGDVKLFGAVGSIVGVWLVLPTLMVVAVMGGALAVCKMIYTRTARTTLLNVAQFFYGRLSGMGAPQFVAATADRRRTIPYGVAICVGSLVSLFVFRA
jgi:prepilin peptidase CpaA